MDQQENQATPAEHKKPEALVTPAVESIDSTTEQAATQPEPVAGTSNGMQKRAAKKLHGFLARRIVLFPVAGLIAASLTLVALGVFSSSEERAQKNVATKLAVKAALAFAQTARTSPTEAFSRYASAQAADHFRIIGERIWQTVSPELGWRWLFQGALMTISPASPSGLTNGTIIGWYHPWSDTALVSWWVTSNQQARLADCEFVMGDVLRQRSLKKPSTTRAWARRRQYFPAAIGITTAESLKSIELLTWSSNQAAPTGQDTVQQTKPSEQEGTNSQTLQTLPITQALAWRTRLPFILTPTNLNANYTGAGVMLLSAISDVTRFSAPTNVFAIRVVPTLQQLHSPSNLLAIAPEANATVKALPKDFMTKFVPAFYANNRQRAFLMLQAKTDPRLCLAFLFKLELPDGKDISPEDEIKQAAERDNQLTALTNLDEIGTNETPAQMYPEAHYPIKLMRADLINLDAAYTNLYQKKRKTP